MFEISAYPAVPGPLRSFLLRTGATMTGGLCVLAGEELFG